MRKWKGLVRKPFFAEIQQKPRGGGEATRIITSKKSHFCKKRLLNHLFTTSSCGCSNCFLFFSSNLPFLFEKKVVTKNCFCEICWKWKQAMSNKAKKRSSPNNSSPTLSKKIICLNKVVSNFYLTGLSKFLKGIQKLSIKFI